MDVLESCPALFAPETAVDAEQGCAGRDGEGFAGFEGAAVQVVGLDAEEADFDVAAVVGA